MRVAVLGAGVMGAGIAYVASLAGMDVGLWDADPVALQRGADRLRGDLDAAVARGKVEADAAQAALDRLRAGSVRGAAVLTPGDG